MFDLCGPMKGCAATQGRHLFMEGDLKYKDNINKVGVLTGTHDFNEFSFSLSFVFYISLLLNWGIFIHPIDHVGFTSNVTRSAEKKNNESKFNELRTFYGL